jgi:diguanylate cyclase (GGDEF)-like protein
LDHPTLFALMNRTLAIKLEQCRTLPTPSSIAMRIIDLAEDPETGIADMAEVLEQDPAMTARMLRIANSALYAQRRKVSNLRQAVMLLGLNGVMSLALGFSLLGSFAVDARASNTLEKIYHRAILSGEIARDLGHRLGVASPDNLFISGVLQDVGILALIRIYGAEYMELLDKADSHQALCRREIAMLGHDHAEIGAWLIQQWHIPEEIQNDIRHSHDSSGWKSSEEDALRVFAVALSGIIADVWLEQDRESALQRVRSVAESWPNLDRDAFGDVVNAVGRRMLHLQELYDIKLLSEDENIAIMERSKELQLIRNLRTIKEAVEVQQKAANLEAINQDLMDRVAHDGLTRVYNRAHFEQVIAEEFEQARKHAWPVSLILLDLDHFKAVNDTYGHQVGDEVLKSVAHVIKQELRGDDMVARYGGEEFVVVLPGTDEDGAAMLGERLLKKLSAGSVVDYPEFSVSVTVSAGLAALSKANIFNNQKELIRAADRALYAAKLAGRACLMVYGETTPRK